MIDILNYDAGVPGIWESYRASCGGGGGISRGPPLPKRAYEISNLPKDFKISAKISDFSRFSKRFQDFSEDFRFREDFKISAKISDFARISAEISRFHVISGEISRFQQRFHGSQRTTYSQGTLRGTGASATECDTASAKVCMREVKGIC